MLGVQRLDQVGEFDGLGGAEADGLVAAGVTQQGGDGRQQFAGWIEQGLSVKHLQPAFLTILGADAEGQAEQLLRHGLIPFCG